MELIFDTVTLIIAYIIVVLASIVVIFTFIIFAGLNAIRNSIRINHIFIRLCLLQRRVG